MSGYKQSAKTGESFLLTYYITRRLAYPLAVAFRRLGVSPNAVTILSGLCWLASVPAVLTGGYFMRETAETAGIGIGCWVAAAVLWNLGAILDVTDGSLARLTNRTSKSGYFLDLSFHFVFNPMFLCSIGIALSLVRGDEVSLLYLTAAVFAVPANWGPAISARHHILCEDVASGAAVKAARGNDRSIFGEFGEVGHSRVSLRGGIALFKKVIFETICFPGQFEFIGLAVLADTAIMFAGIAAPPLALTEAAFWICTAVGILRTPFRIRREFSVMRKYERILQR